MDKKKIKRIIKENKNVTGIPFSYPQFTNLLKTTKYKDYEKKKRQLEVLSDFIDYTISDKGKITVLGVKKGNRWDKVELLGIKNYYNRGKGSADDITIPEITRVALMEAIKRNLQEGSRDLFMTTYENLASLCGFLNESGSTSIRKSHSKIAEIFSRLSGGTGVILSRQVRLVFETAREKYVKSINKALKALKRGEYIDYKIRFWGYRKESNGYWNRFERLTKNEVKTYRDISKRIARELVGKDNLHEVRLKHKEEEYYGLLNEAMENTCGLKHIGQKIEITLGGRATDIFLRGFKCTDREYKWLNKHFFEEVKKRGLRKIKKSLEKNVGEFNEEDKDKFILLSEVFLKTEREADREELKYMRRELERKFM